MEKDIIEGNRLIAEFDKSIAINSPHLKDDSELEYHSSWASLMPVVEKIWRMGKMISLNLYTEGGGTVNAKIYNWGLGDPYQESENTEPIIAMWQAVVQFIRWYNSLSSVKQKQ
jgi:hypothetical protein